MQVLFKNGPYEFMFDRVAGINQMALTTWFEIEPKDFVFSDVYGEYFGRELPNELCELVKSNNIRGWRVKPNGNIEITAHTALIDCIR